MKQFKTLSLAIPAALALAACGTKATPSSLKHDMDRPVRSSEGWQWIATTHDQYKSHIAPLVGVDGDAILGNDHKLVKRVQFWLDKVDASLRAEHPTELANVPKPQAKVIVDDSANAFVAPIPVCYKAAVKVKDGTANASTTRDRVYLDVQTGELSDFPEDYKCLEGTDATALAVLAAQFNATSTGCKFALQGTGAATKLTHSGCKVNEDLGDTVSGKSVVILQTANFVTVHTGIFGILDEAPFVAVLAHELGHYYRSHITAHESAYDFFYTLGRDAVAHRPVAEVAAKAPGDKAFAAATMLGANDYFTAVDAQLYRSELFFATGGLIRKVAAVGTGVPAECKTANEFLKTEAFKTAIDKFPFTSSDDAMLDAYKSFEAKARACLAKLTVKSGGAVVATGASWVAFKDLVTAPVWPSWLGSLPDSTQGALLAMFQVIEGRVGDAPAAGAKWDDVLLGKSNSLDQQDEAGILALRTAHEQHIGQYTIEQEADDEAAEWIAQMGFDPKAAVEAMHALVKGDETSMQGLLLGQNDCEALWNNDWLNAAGEYQFVPVGDYSEIHHSTCYRMFNMEREIKAHGLEASGAPVPQHGGQLWKDLQKAATDEQGSNVFDLIGGNGPLNLKKLSSLVKKSNAFECVYTHSYH